MVWLWRLCTNFAHPIPKIDFSSPETMDGFRTELGRHRIIATPKKEQARRVGNLEITRKTSSEPCWKYVSASFLEALSIKHIKTPSIWGLSVGIPLFGTMTPSGGTFSTLRHAKDGSREPAKRGGGSKGLNHLVRWCFFSELNLQICSGFSIAMIAGGYPLKNHLKPKPWFPDVSEPGYVHMANSRFLATLRQSTGKSPTKWRFKDGENAG